MNKKIIFITVACFFLGTIMTWQYKSIRENQKISSVDNFRIENLKDELLIQKNLNDDLSVRNIELELQISQLENAKGDINLLERNLKNELDKARLVAGLSDVKGEGIIIRLDNTDVGLVTDTDILNILNELRATDAQAISVNGERIVSVSEVRETTGYIIINGQQMYAPFEIKAIADPVKLENALNILGGVVENLVELYRLNCTIEKKDEIYINKVNSYVYKTDYLNSVDWNKIKKNLSILK